MKRQLHGRGFRGDRRRWHLAPDIYAGEVGDNVVEHPRNAGDFSNLGGSCFPRTSVRFVQQDHPARGWPGLFPAEDK